MADPIHLTSLSPGILSGGNRPETIPLGRITAIVGPSGSGKTRVVTALSLLTTGTYSGVAFRSGVIKDRGLLLRLVSPDATQVRVEGHRSDGDTLTWTMGIERSPDAPPVCKTPRPGGQWWGDGSPLALAGVLDTLRKDPAEARARFLPSIVGKVNAKSVRTALDPELADPLPEVLPEGTTPPATYLDLKLLGLSVPATVDDLRTLRTTLTAQETTLAETVKIQAAVRAEAEVILPEEPTEELIELVTQTREGILLIEAHRAQTAQLANLDARITLAREHLDAVAPPPGDPPIPTAAGTWESVVAIQRALRGGLAFPGDGPRCVVCGTPASAITTFAPAALTAERLAQADQTQQQGLAAAQAAWEAAVHNRAQGEARLAEFTSLRDRIQQEIATIMQRIQGFAHKDAVRDQPGTAGVLAALWVADDTALGTARVEIEKRLDHLTKARFQWTTYRERRARAQASDGSEAKLMAVRRLLARLEAAIKRLIADGRLAFEGRMARYMPRSLAPKLYLEDQRGNPLFWLTVVDQTTGIEGYAPSGGQSFALLVAFTAAILEASPPKWALFVPPEEVYIDGTLLGDLVRAWSALPKWIQVIVVSGEAPKGKLPAEAVVVQLGRDGSMEQG